MQFKNTLLAGAAVVFALVGLRACNQQFSPKKLESSTESSATEGKTEAAEVKKEAKKEDSKEQSSEPVDGKKVAEAEDAKAKEPAQDVVAKAPAAKPIAKKVHSAKKALHKKRMRKPLRAAKRVHKANVVAKSAVAEAAVPAAVMTTDHHKSHRNAFIFGN